MPHLEARARERMLATQNNAAAMARVPELGQGRARDAAGALVGISGRLVSDARAPAIESPTGTRGTPCDS